MRNEAVTYTPKQLAGAERAIMILQSMPKDTRELAAMVASAFVDGLKAGQQLAEKKQDPDGLAD